MFLCRIRLPYYVFRRCVIGSPYLDSNACVFSFFFSNFIFDKGVMPL